MRVLRGRLLRAVATASRSSAAHRDRSVPLGKYWRSSPFGVLVAASLPGAVRVSEEDRDPGLDFELGVRRELFATVPGHRSAELFGQRRHRSGQAVLHRDRAVAGQRGPVLDGVLMPVTLLARQVHQHREPRGPLDKGADRGPLEPDDQVAFPVPGDCTVLGFGGALTDQHLRGDMRPGRPLRPGPRSPQRTPGAKAGHQLTL